MSAQRSIARLLVDEGAAIRLVSARAREHQEIDDVPGRATGVDAATFALGGRQGHEQGHGATEL